MKVVKEEFLEDIIEHSKPYTPPCEWEVGGGRWEVEVGGGRWGWRWEVGGGGGRWEVGGGRWRWEVEVVCVCVCVCVCVYTMSMACPIQFVCPSHFSTGVCAQLRSGSAQTQPEQAPSLHKQHSNKKESLSQTSVWVEAWAGFVSAC